MTPETLVAAIDCPLPRAMKWADVLTESMTRYDISTPARQAAFLAQVGHESMRLARTREMWAPAQCPWQARYEGKADLGNTQPGDGMRYMGRGLIQITGRANYRACGAALGQDFENGPGLLEVPKWAALSAAWYWHSRGLNALADAGDHVAITKRINGGTNGLEDRLALVTRCQKALGV